MFTTPRIIAIALCAALNFAVGSIVYLTKLPIYLDSIGTILCAMLIYPDRTAAFVCAFVAAMISTVITTLVHQPVPDMVHAYRGRDLASLQPSSLRVVKRLFRERPLPIVRFAIRVILSGILLGLVSAVVSAPVVAYVFGGVTGSGSAFLVAFFLKAGEHLMSAVLHSGLTAEPIDKIAAGAAGSTAVSRHTARISSRWCARASNRRRHDAKWRGRFCRHCHRRSHAGARVRAGRPCLVVLAVRCHRSRPAGRRSVATRGDFDFSACGFHDHRVGRGCWPVAGADRSRSSRITRCRA